MKHRVKEYVKHHGLDKPNRARQKNYNRIILANILKQEHCTLEEIGQIMNRHHATVIHMLKNYVFLSSYSDFRQQERRIKEELKHYTLEERVMKVQNMADLWHLQEYVKEIQKKAPM